MPKVLRCILLATIPITAATAAACGGDGSGASDVRRGTTEEVCTDFAAARDTLDFAPRVASDFGLIREGLLGLRYPEDLVPVVDLVIPALTRLEDELQDVDLTSAEGQAALDAVIADADVGRGMTASAAISRFATTTCEGESP
ncbi:MAG: hypothetical protein ABIR68_03355 [Ilumatobacteraceae bacterium]